MENKRIKSAWEIALERAEKLGQISPEEVQATEEAKYTPIGQSLAVRYLSELSLRDFQFLLDKHTGQARRIVEKAAALTLIDALSLDAPSNARRAAEALQVLAPELHLTEKARAAQLLVEEYLRMAEERITAERESLARKAEARLRALGIAGSAVSVNLEASPEWSGFVAEVRSDFGDRLAVLKSELRSQIGG